MQIDSERIILCTRTSSSDSSIFWCVCVDSSVRNPSNSEALCVKCLRENTLEIKYVFHIASPQVIHIFRIISSAVSAGIAMPDSAGPSGNFLHKPVRGWLHPDNQIMKKGVIYHVRVRYRCCLMTYVPKTDWRSLVLIIVLGDNRSYKQY